MIGRSRVLAALGGAPFDVAVIGGGITGAGVALDAASRGFSVALVEREDWASGTSSRSSKLIHGGLRYLRSLDLGLVREGLVERGLLVRLAPHLVRPLEVVVPGPPGGRPPRITGFGLGLYDLLAAQLPQRTGGDDTLGPAWRPGRHRLADPREIGELLPALAGPATPWGYVFEDCQTDDARLVLAALAAAERFGALAVNRCEALAPLERNGRVAGLRCRDRLTGDELELRARHVVSATGIWAEKWASGDPGAPHIRPSRGTHLVFSSEDLPVRAGAIIPSSGGRTIFVLPWLGHTLVGTTDHDHEGAAAPVRPTEEDVDELLAACNRSFAADLRPEHVRGAYAGLRPLISSRAARSTAVSRRALLHEGPNGLLTVTGGKLTAWRAMAEQAVDRVAAREGRGGACRTGSIPLGRPVEARDLALSPELAAHLAGRYGHGAHRLAALIARAPELRRPIVAGLPDPLAEAVHAARHEQALSVADVLLRRTRLGLLAGRELCAPGAPAPRRVAAALGAELGWDRGRVLREVARWREDARAEGLVPGARRTEVPAAA